MFVKSRDSLDECGNQLGRGGRKPFEVTQMFPVLIVVVLTGACRRQDTELYTDTLFVLF